MSTLCRHYSRRNISYSSYKNSSQKFIRCGLRTLLHSIIIEYQNNFLWGVYLSIFATLKIKTCNPITGHTHQGNQNWKRHVYPMFIAALFTLARTWKQPRFPSADEWMKKLGYIYTTEYYSAIKKNAFESVLMRWMKLEPIIQSEVSQKEKHKYSILTHIYGN